MMKPGRLEYFKRHMTSRAGIAIGVACLAPPPFPFTLVIASASAFGYPRARLLGLVFVTRSIRFMIVGLLAVHFGRQIVSIAQAPLTTWIMVGFIALCFLGSAFQVAQWIRPKLTRSGSDLQIRTEPRPWSRRNGFAEADEGVGRSPGGLPYLSFLMTFPPFITNLTR